jgi:hypothetical protein
LADVAPSEIFDEFLFHLALRAASMPGGDAHSDIKLLVRRAVCAAPLKQAAELAQHHLDTHPDDPRLVAAHRLLVAAVAYSEPEPGSFAGRPSP